MTHDSACRDAPEKNSGSNKCTCSSPYTPLTQLGLSIHCHFGTLSTDHITPVLPMQSAGSAMHPADALHDLQNGQTSSTA